MNFPPLPDICDSIVLDAEAVQARVAALGSQLSDDLVGHDVRLVTILRGGLFFLADLSRAMTLDTRLDFIAVSSYSPKAGGVVRVTKDLDDSVRGATVVVVEDVVGTGLTLNYVLSFLRAHGPEHLIVCTLLDKPSQRIVPVQIDYTGFSVPDAYLVSYGLDVRGRYRNLPYVASVKPEVMHS